MQKRLPFTAIICIAMLSGCTTLQNQSAGNTTGVAQNTPIATAQNVGMNLLKSAIDNRCRSELERQNMWRVARVAMSAEQEEQAKTRVCGCVSEQAPQHVTLNDIASATIDTNYRAQLVTKVVAESLQACYSSVVQ